MCSNYEDIIKSWGGLEKYREMVHFEGTRFEILSSILTPAQKQTLDVDQQLSQTLKQDVECQRLLLEAIELHSFENVTKREYRSLTPAHPKPTVNRYRSIVQCPEPHSARLISSRLELVWLLLPTSLSFIRTRIRPEYFFQKAVHRNCCRRAVRLYHTLQRTVSQV